MEKNCLIDIFKKTSDLLSKNHDKCNNLIFTQKRNNKTIIREPEARFALTHVLTNMNINFGIEVPTKKKYKFSGKSDRITSARIDLSIFTKLGQINIELKEGPRETVKKDIEKLMREDTTGCAIYHILQNSDTGTLPAILNKYKRAYDNTKNLKEIYSKWFILFIYIKEKHECFWKIFDNITNISENEFDIKSFIKYSCRASKIKTSK
ncbi:MAG: hypothetical protein N2748_06240 [candidate division WOR-3 bacterium]|nr:hypothetical protein [candidate division WOR-3 bacterium]